MNNPLDWAEHQNGQSAEEIFAAAETIRAQRALYAAVQALDYPSEADHILAHSLGVEL